MIDPEQFVEAGQALVQLGRYIQRTYRKPTVEGAQFGEDSVLAELLPHDNGIYVDVGANDPFDCSNTHRLYQRGWRGLLVEPLFECWPALLMERAEDYLFPGAASDREGFATLHRCRSVSSLDPRWRDDVEGTMPVYTERLQTILKRYPQVDWSKTDFMSVDVEGHEAAVLRGIDWATFKPKVICVEFADQQGNDISGSWRGILESQQYHLHFANSLNQIWSQ